MKNTINIGGLYWSAKEQEWSFVPSKDGKLDGFTPRTLCEGGARSCLGIGFTGENSPLEAFRHLKRPHKKGAVKVEFEDSIAGVISPYQKVSGQSGYQALGNSGNARQWVKDHGQRHFWLTFKQG